jgi:hypothetical protein
LSFLLLFIGFPAFFGIQNAFADTASAGATDVSCGLTTADFTAISDIQNNASLGYLDEVKAELAARKSLLTKTILCAKQSAMAQRNTLENITVSNNLQNLKTQWLGRLDDAIAYYDLQLAKTNTAGINGTQTIAREVLAWRNNNYALLAENVSHFILWSQNQNLFTTADQRLAQIKNLVGSPLFAENGEMQSDLQAAAVSLRTAEDQNAAAENAFAQSLAPDQSIALVQQSLDSLSLTYRHFFDISTLVQSLLPQ